MKRNPSLDILKGIMACMVVCLHSEFLQASNYTGGHLLTNGIFRMAVPIFLVINGFYFFLTVSNKTYSSWIKRATFLYIIWTAVYYYAWGPYTNWSPHSPIRVLLVGYHHLWYLPGMLGSGITLLLLHKLGSRTLLTTAAIAFAIGITIQYYGNYHIRTDSVFDRFAVAEWSHRNFIFLCYPFFCLGFIIHKHEIHISTTKNTALLISISGIILLLVESYVNAAYQKSDKRFENLFALIVACPALFVYCTKFDLQWDSKYLAQLATAIYFIHPAIIYILQKLTQLRYTSLTLATIPLAIVCSIPVIALNRKLKIIL